MRQQGGYAMENYDPRRRQGGEDESRRYPPHNEERGRDDERYADRGGRQERYGQRGSERSKFSPDWSREGAEPRYSDDPYYSRNRDLGREDYSGSHPRSSRGDDDRSRWEQRQGREVQRSRDDEQGHYRGYYSQSTTPFAYPGGQGYLYSESITLHGPYSGRGPKGYRRSDQQLIEEASQRLERDGHVDATDIEVTADDGIITLRGTVPDRRTKRCAEECVESVYGARDVMNELRLAPQSGEQSQGSQTSLQSSQRAQGTRGSLASSTSTPRGGATPPSSEQSADDRRPPKH
jgi:hypothetical protein